MTPSVDRRQARQTGGRKSTHASFNRPALGRALVVGKGSFKGEEVERFFAGWKVDGGRVSEMAGD